MNAVGIAEQGKLDIVVDDQRNPMTTADLHQHGGFGVAAIRVFALVAVLNNLGAAGNGACYRLLQAGAGVQRAVGNGVESACG